MQEMASQQRASVRHASGSQTVDNYGTDGMLSASVAIPDFAPNLALPWVLRLRYGMVVGEVAIIIGMSFGLRLEIPLLWTLAPLAVVLASNIYSASFESCL